MRPGTPIGLCGSAMNALWYLIPISIGLGTLGLALFFWALRSAQYEGPALLSAS